jgi:hypothetical protein
MPVPTKYGWVFVNPYMTLVAAYERLIGARGTQLEEEPPIVLPIAAISGARAAAGRRCRRRGRVKSLYRRRGTTESRT